MKKHFHIWMIVIPILIIIALIVFAYFRIKGFLNPVTIDTEIEESAIEAYEDNYDVIMPLMKKEGYIVKQDIKKILLFGNDPFAEDRDSEDGMAAMIAEATGAEVINCSISGTYASQTIVGEPLENPMDVYTPYYLCTLACFPDTFSEVVDEGGVLLGDAKPADADEVVETLKNIDLTQIDMVVFFYDLTDYYLDHPTYITEISKAEDTFSGNMYLAVNMLSVRYPNIRIICMSPYYNSFTDDEGNPISAELVKNSYGTPGDYVLSEGGGVQIYTATSFIDNYFGSITQDNYENYLRDSKHLNQAGRELLVQRLYKAIHYYD